MKRFEEEEYVPYSANEARLDADELAWDHALDISGSIYSRLRELGMSQKDLADSLGVSAGRISQVIKGEPGMSLRTLARIEAALGFDLGSGFRYVPEDRRGATSFRAQTSLGTTRHRPQLRASNGYHYTLIGGGAAA